MNRDLKLDGLKFILIFCVVLGHIGYNDYGLGISRIIYSFHMPMFVFLSGYFTSPNCIKKKQADFLKRTLLIYAIAQLAHFVLNLGLEYIHALWTHKAFDSTLLTWKILVEPGLALWYLVCLMYWRYAIWKLFPNTSDKTLLCISCLLALFSGIVPIDNSFAFQRAFSFFPFFVIGHLFRKNNLIEKTNKIPWGYALITILVGFMIARNLPMYMPKLHYLYWYDPIYRIIQSCLGFLLCLSFIIITRFDFIERFAKYGSYTIWIYIGHTYLLKIGYKAFPFLGISFNLFTALLLSFFYCALFIIVAEAYHSYKDKTFFFSSFFNK